MSTIHHEQALIGNTHEANGLRRERIALAAEAVTHLLDFWYDETRTHMPNVITNLHNFEVTNQTTMLFRSRNVPIFSAVAAGVYSATRNYPETFEGTPHLVTGVPLPPEIQEHIGLANDDMLNAAVWQAPMEKVGFLQKLEYDLNERQTDGSVRPVHEIMLLASPHPLELIDPSQLED